MNIGGINDFGETDWSSSNKKYSWEDITKNLDSDGKDWNE